MANIFTLNTADHPTLTQVLVNTPIGLFDFKAQMSAGSVTVSNPAAKAVLATIKNPTTGRPFLNEA